MHHILLSRYFREELKQTIWRRGLSQEGPIGLPAQLQVLWVVTPWKHKWRKGKREKEKPFLMGLMIRWLLQWWGPSDEPRWKCLMMAPARDRKAGALAYQSHPSLAEDWPWTIPGMRTEQLPCVVGSCAESQRDVVTGGGCRSDPAGTVTSGKFQCVMSTC